MTKTRNKLKATGLLLTMVLLLALLGAFSLTAGAAAATDLLVTTHSFDENGICTVCTVCKHYEAAVPVTEENCEALGLTSNYVGYYAIGNAGQLYWFAQLVNIDSTEESGYANAVLVADIDLNGGTWYPIGVYYDAYDTSGNQNKESIYNGVFDGNNHTVSNFIASGNYSQGLIGYSGANAVVRNLGVINAKVSGWNAGAVLALSGLVENCYAIDCQITATTTATVSNEADLYAGAVAGTQSATVKNSFAYKCTVFAGNGFERKAQLAPVGGATPENCYYGEITAALGSLIYVAGEHEMSDNALTSGELACLLGSPPFGQNIDNGTQNEGKPVLGGAPVYQNQTGGCTDASYTYEYANTKKDPVTTHVLDANGICTVCVGYEAAKWVTEGNYEALGLTSDHIGYYAISNASQLFWFAHKVNNGETSLNAVLAANIVLNTGVIDGNGNLVSDHEDFLIWTPMGNSTHEFSGIFDGYGHTIAGVYVVGTTTAQGLFGKVSGTVKNLGVIDSYVSGTNGVGGVIGTNNGGQITKSYFTGLVVGSKGGAGVGGVVGNNAGAVTYCYSMGHVTGTGVQVYVGGVVGYNDGGTIENSFSTAKVTGEQSTDSVGGVAGVNRVQNTIKNCYYLMYAATGGIAGEDTTGVAEAKSSYLFSTGKVAYLLNGGVTDGTQAFYQTLAPSPTVTFPSFTGLTVYKRTNCQYVLEYSNFQGTHSFVNGVCTNTDCKMVAFHIYGQRVNIGKDLSMKYYVKAATTELDPTLLTMQFSFLDKTTIATGVYDEAAKCYVFVLRGINAQCMGEDIDAYVLYDGQAIHADSAKKLDYSVEDNLNNLLEERSGDAKLVTLINDLLVYGKAAEAYIGYASIEGSYTGSDREVNETTVSNNADNQNLKVSWVTVRFGVSNYIKFGMTAQDKPTVKMGDEVLTVVEEGGEYVVTSPDILATDFGQVLTFTISCGEDEITLNYSVYAYIYTICQSDTASDGMKALAKALYNYGVSAEAYVEASTPSAE